MHRTTAEHSLYGWGESKGKIFLHTLRILSYPPAYMIQTNYQGSLDGSREFLLFLEAFIIFCSNVYKYLYQKCCPVLIVGIGNILLQDEGFGPHVIEALQKVELPESVELLDGGTAGADLVDFICDRRKVIFIDAVRADVRPGSILRMTIADLTANLGHIISLHEFGIVETLKVAEQLGCAPEEVVIFGVRPEQLSCGTELSEKVAAAMPKVIKLVLDELSQ